MCVKYVIETRYKKYLVKNKTPSVRYSLGNRKTSLMCASLVRVTRVVGVGVEGLGRRGYFRRTSTITPDRFVFFRARASGGGDDDDDGGDAAAAAARRISSPKDGKRTKAGARRMRDDATAVADALLSSASRANALVSDADA